MLPTLRIGPLALQTSGLIVLLGFWGALELSARQAGRLGIGASTISNAGWYGVLAGLARARLDYVVQHWSIYRTGLLGALALNPQTLHPVAGFLGGALAAGLYLWRKRVPVRPLLAAAAPGLAAGFSALALANLASGAGYGRETSLPWAIDLWSAQRHPAQLYELAAGAISLLILWRAGRTALAPGQLFLLSVALLGGARLLLEPFRANSALIMGGFRAAQAAGLVAVLGAIWLVPIWSGDPPPALARARATD